VAPWIAVLSLHIVFTRGVMIYKFTLAPSTGPRHIWCIYTQCLFSGRENNTVGSGVAMVISLANAGYGSSWVAQHLFQPNLVFQSVWGWGDLGSFQLLQLNFSPEGDEKILW